MRHGVLVEIGIHVGRSRARRRRRHRSGGTRCGGASGDVAHGCGQSELSEVEAEGGRRGFVVHAPETVAEVSTPWWGSGSGVVPGEASISGVDGRRARISDIAVMIDGNGFSMRDGDAEESAPAIREAVVQTDIHQIVIAHGFTAVDEIVELGVGIQGCGIGRGVIHDQLSRHRIDSGCRNLVPGKGIAQVVAGRRVQMGGIGIVNEDGGAGGIAEVREIAAFPFVEGSGDAGHVRRPLPGALVIHEEKSAVAALIKMRQHDGSSQRPAELIALEGAERKADPVAKEVIGVHFGIAQKVVRTAVEGVGARAGNDVQHASLGMAVLGSGGVGDDRELLKAVDGGFVGEFGQGNGIGGQDDGGPVDRHFISGVASSANPGAGILPAPAEDARSQVSQR